MTDSRLALASISLGQRVRKDMGDLRALADSIVRHGLLHPVVVMKDGMLVAGARRIEAARLLGWDDVPATVVDVDDLLSAERDENTERKDFTPTEAVAIGKLIEERERPKAVERRRESGLARAAAPRDERGRMLPGGQPMSKQPLAGEKTRTIAAKAVGMGESQYKQAKSVVAAAESDPETFGDLPAKMDETGSVAGAHLEMQRRKGSKPQDRSVVHHKAHRPQANKEMQRAVLGLEGLCLGLKDIDIKQLDPSQAMAWSKSLGKSMTIIRRLYLRLKNVKTA